MPTDSKLDTVDVEELNAQFPFITNTVDSTSLVTALNTARAVKNEYELEMLRHSSQVTLTLTTNPNH